jgi:hypothetical protein
VKDFTWWRKSILYFPHLLFSFGEIRSKKSAHDAAESLLFSLKSHMKLKATP